MTFLRAASVGLFMLGACALEENTQDVEQHLPSWGCDEFGCGMNSSQVDNYDFHDFHGLIDPATGASLPNSSGIRLTRIEWQKPGCVPACPIVPMKKIYSQNAQLGATNGAITIGAGTPTSMVGTLIRLEGPSGKYDLRIIEVGRTQYWAKPTGMGTVWGTTYKLEWDVEVAPGQKRTWENVCTNPLSDGNPELRGMNAYHTIAFEDDAIDAKTKTIKARGSNSNWINIGCAGHALAKLHLSGHTSGAVNQHAFHTGTREHQTMLKMIVADYCGAGSPNEGYPFTVAGQPLEWADAPSENTYSLGFGGAKEAEWTEKGASCLNKPRINANPTVDGLAAFPNVEADIIAVCGGRPSKCDDDVATNFNGHHLVSANP